MIRIHKASKKDAGAIIDLLQYLGRPTPNDKKERAAFERLILQYLSDRDKRIIAAYSGAKVVGIATIVFMDRLNRTAKEMYVAELVVMEPYQNKGVGKKLMRSCVTLARQKKCFRVRLESGFGRKKSHKFYKKIGFEGYALTFRKSLRR